MKVRPVLPKLLLVDDRPANLLALEAVLGDVEYQLLKAQSGPEALALLRAHPDIVLILLDVQMPGMDGFEVSRRIKNDPALSEIPIIFITAICTEDPFVRQGYQAGAVDYFSKPFDPEILKLKVGIYASFRQKVTLLKEKEQQLARSQELLRTGRKLSAILESVPVGVIIADRDGRVCQMNDEVLKILKSMEQTQTDSYGEFLNWWERDGHLLKGARGPLMRAMQGLSSQDEVIRIRCLDGAVKLVFASASPLRALDRSIIGAVVVIQDVTSRREVQAELERRVVDLVSLGVEIEEAVLDRQPLTDQNN